MSFLHRVTQNQLANRSLDMFGVLARSLGIDYRTRSRRALAVLKDSKKPAEITEAWAILCASAHKSRYRLVLEQFKDKIRWAEKQNVYDNLSAKNPEAALGYLKKYFKIFSHILDYIPSDRRDDLMQGLAGLPAAKMAAILEKNVETGILNGQEIDWILGSFEFKDLAALFHATRYGYRIPIFARQRIFASTYNFLHDYLNYVSRKPEEVYEPRMLEFINFTFQYIFDRETRFNQIRCENLLEDLLNREPSLLFAVFNAGGMPPHLIQYLNTRDLGGFRYLGGFKHLAEVAARDAAEAYQPVHDLLNVLYDDWSRFAEREKEFSRVLFTRAVREVVERFDDAHIWSLLSGFYGTFIDFHILNNMHTERAVGLILKYSGDPRIADDLRREKVWLSLSPSIRDKLIDLGFMPMD